MRKTIGLVLALLALCLPSAVLAQSTAFQWDVRGVGGLYSHTPDDPLSTWTFIGSGGGGLATESSVIACDTDSFGNLFGVDINTNELGQIDLVTAEFTLIGALTGDVPPVVQAMTIDMTDDTAYISDGTGLWSMDITTGVCTQISASFNDSAGGAAVTTVFELATDSAGNFWAFDITLDTLWDLDITNGSLTAVGVYNGPMGRDGPNFSNNGMDWDPVSGQLIGDVYTGGGTGSYGTWDTTTGSFTEILNHDSFPPPYATNIGGPIACFGGTTFHMNFWANDYNTYDTLDPTSNFTGRPQPSAPDLFAIDFNETGTLYAVDSANLNLGVIDTATGDYTSLMPLTGDFILAGGTATGITCDVVDGTFYLCNTTTLFTLDIMTGNTVTVADFTSGLGNPVTGAIGIASNSIGELYMFSVDTDALFRVDKNTGAGIFLGNAPGNAGFVQGMDFDPADDTLYASIYVSGGTGFYGTWDTTTGAFTTITTLETLPPDGDGYELMLAIMEAPAIVDLVPESFNLVNGVLDSVDPLAELSMSDNDDLRASRDQFAIGARVIYEVGVTSPNDMPAGMDLTIEESIFARGAVNRTIQLFNYDTAAFETVDAQLANQGFGDRTDVISVTGDPSRFVEAGTGAVLARVRYDGPVPRAAFTCNVDNIFITISN